MPKLDTTVDNLEVTRGKITDGLPSSSWTDNEYVSGQTVYEAYTALNDTIKATHPVGSVICMSTNTDPSASLGGTWTLIDKEFKRTWITLNAADWTATNATFSEGSLVLYGNTGMLRLCIQPTAAVADTTITMGKINLANYGFGEMYFSCVSPAQGDGANASILYQLNIDGTVSFHDALHVDGTHSITSGYTLYLTNYVAWKLESTPDKYCDKFYFKRIA